MRQTLLHLRHQHLLRHAHLRLRHRCRAVPGVTSLYSWDGGGCVEDMSNMLSEESRKRRYITSRLSHILKIFSSWLEEDAGTYAIDMN